MLKIWFKNEPDSFYSLISAFDVDIPKMLII